ncbi:sugar dehydrogenase complex small subunit [Frateuria aurantia]
MDSPSRDDAPPEFRLSRRRLLLGGGLLAGAFALDLPAQLLALPTERTTFGPRFMQLSSLLVNHRLDPQIGLRMAAAMKAAQPELPMIADRLLKLAQAHGARVVEDFFPYIAEGTDKQAALGIIAAWYRGVLVDTPDAEVFTYEQALMYQPTADVMTIPSYAISGPNGWTSKAPPLSDMPEF